MTLPGSAGEIVFPSGLVSETTTFTYTEEETPSEDTGSLVFAGQSFTLIAQDEQGNPITEFNTTFTITLNYEDSDWQNAGIPDESLLNLYYWNGTAWVGVLPCTGCSLDTEANRLVAMLNHLTEFALVGPQEPPTLRRYMPLILR